jgi:hypothetical protein
MRVYFFVSALLVVLVILSACGSAADSNEANSGDARPPAPSAAKPAPRPAEPAGVLKSPDEEPPVVVPQSAHPAAVSQTREFRPAPPAAPHQKSPEDQEDWWAPIAEVADEAITIGNSALRRLWQRLCAPQQAALAAAAKGFSSSAGFGAGLSTLSVAAPAVLVKPALLLSLDLSDLAALRVAAGTFVRQHSLEFFYYSLGSIAADVICLLVLKRLVAGSPAERRNARNGPSRFWSSHVGFAALALFAAVPHGFLDISVPLAVLLRLSAEAAVASVCIGKLLRPYVVAVLLAAADEGIKANATLAALRRRFSVFSSSSSEEKEVLAALLWGAVVATVMLAVLSKVLPRNDDEELLLDED